MQDLRIRLVHCSKKVHRTDAGKIVCPRTSARPQKPRVFVRITGCLSASAGPAQTRSCMLRPAGRPQTRIVQAVEFVAWCPKRLFAHRAQRRLIRSGCRMCMLGYHASALAVHPRRADLCISCKRCRRKLPASGRCASSRLPSNASQTDGASGRTGVPEAFGACVCSHPALLAALFYLWRWGARSSIDSPNRKFDTSHPEFSSSRGAYEREKTTAGGSR